MFPVSPEIGDPVEHRVGTVAKWGQECYIWDMIHYFTMKNYSHRRKLNKLRKELETEKK